MVGHVFVVNGDLNAIACDAMLIPTDQDWVFEDWTRPTRERFRPPLVWQGTAMQMAVDVDEAWPRVWYGHVGTTADAGIGHFVNCAAQFVEAATTQLRAEPPETGVRPVDWPKDRLALNLIGSGRGGAERIKGGLIAALLKRLLESATALDVDIVLVLNGDVAFAAAQRARRQLIEDGDYDQHEIWGFVADDIDRLHDKAEEIAQHARANHLVQFVGAGVSAGAGVPLWKDLLREAGGRRGIPVEQVDALLHADLRDVASVLESLPAESDTAESWMSFQDAVAETISRTRRYSTGHALLASLPSFEAVTTNFDTLLERAASSAGRPLAVLPDSPLESGGRWVLKLHGSVTEPDEMVLTRADYLNMPRQYGALMGLVQAMLLMRHMLFIGYSLSDEDLHELLHEVRVARSGRGHDSAKPVVDRPFGTVLTLFENPVLGQLWTGDLDVFPIARNDTSLGFPEVGRLQEIFLDLIAYHATTRAPYFLDPTWDELLTEGDKALKPHLEALAGSLNEDVADREVVKGFLRRFGWDG